MEKLRWKDQDARKLRRVLSRAKRLSSPE